MENKMIKPFVKLPYGHGTYHYVDANKVEGISDDYSMGTEFTAIIIGNDTFYTTLTKEEVLELVREARLGF